MILGYTVPILWQDVEHHCIWSHNLCKSESMLFPQERVKLNIYQYYYPTGIWPGIIRHKCLLSVLLSADDGGRGQDEHIIGHLRNWIYHSTDFQGNLAIFCTQFSGTIIMHYCPKESNLEKYFIVQRLMMVKYWTKFRIRRPRFNLHHVEQINLCRPQICSVLLNENDTLIPKSQNYHKAQMIPCVSIL